VVILDEKMETFILLEKNLQWITNRPRRFKRGFLGKPIFGYEVKLVDTKFLK